MAPPAFLVVLILPLLLVPVPLQGQHFPAGEDLELMLRWLDEDGVRWTPGKDGCWVRAS